MSRRISPLATVLLPHDLFELLADWQRWNTATPGTALLDVRKRKMVRNHIGGD